MQRIAGKRSSGFLLIEVLVALAVFAVMVGALNGFIAQWLHTDAEQRMRHSAMTAACDVLERMKCALPGEGESSNQSIRVAAQQIDAQHIWASVPRWVMQLKPHERPVHYRISADGFQRKLGAGRVPIAVQVVG